MGFIRRRTRRRTMLMAGGMAYAAGKRAQAGQDQEEPVGEPQDVAATGGDDQIDELAKLAELHESGALTDEEFEAEKAKILGT
jgi:hypothetical protein